MIGLITLIMVLVLITGLGKWATKQRIKRQYEDYYKDCCGTDCGCHSDKKKEKAK
jgi:hypothetical protein